MEETIRKIKELADRADKGLIPYEDAIRQINQLTKRYVCNSFTSGGLSSF